MVSHFEPIDIGVLDELTADDVAQRLRSVCASSRWLSVVAASRPFGTRARLHEVARTALDGLTWADFEEALAAHPRLGERALGDEPEAEFSRAEQARLLDLGDDSAARLRQSNADYEDTFGWAFLVSADGLSIETLLSELDRRRGNDPLTERREVRRELGKIVDARLDKVVSGS